MLGNFRFYFVVLVVFGAWAALEQHGMAQDEVEGDVHITTSQTYSTDLLIDGDLYIENSSTLTIDNGTTENWNGYIGAGSSGAVIVTGSSAVWENDYNLTIGDGSSIGTLTISNGGTAYAGYSSGDSTIQSGAITVTGNNSTFNVGGDLNIGSGGNGSLTISDGGTVYVSDSLNVGANGGTGVLNIGAAAGDTAVAAGTLDSSITTINLGDDATGAVGTIVFNHTDSGYVFSPQIFGPGGVSVYAGTTILANDEQYTGDTNIYGGTLQIGQAENGVEGSISDYGTVRISSGGTLILDQTDGSMPSFSIINNGTVIAVQNDPWVTTLYSDISGAGSFVQNGTGTTVLAGANSYSGGTVINNGTVQVGEDGDYGNLGSGGVIDNGLLFYYRSDTLQDNNSISGTGKVLVDGDSGTVILGGNNTYTGGTSVGDDFGTTTRLTLSGSNNFGSGQVLVNTDATLQLQANAANTGSFTTASTALGTASGGLIFNDYSTLELRSDKSVTFAGGDNFMAENATVGIDVNQLTSSGSNQTIGFALGGFEVGNASINVTGGHGYNLSLGVLMDVFGSGSSDYIYATTANVTLAGITAASSGMANIYLQGPATGNFVTGAITDGSGQIYIEKDDAGTWTLSGNNTYTGGTYIAAGTLILTGNNNTGGGSVEVTDGAILQLQADANNTGSFTSASTALGFTNSLLTLDNNSTVQLRSEQSTTFAGGDNLGGVGDSTINFDVDRITSGLNQTLGFAAGGFDVGNTTINITGGHGYSLSLGVLNDVGDGLDTINPTTASVTIAGLTSGSGLSTFNLAGTSTGNAVTGGITDDNGGQVSVEKSGSSMWTLSGTNTYSGATSIVSGSLVAGSTTGLSPNSAFTLSNTDGATLSLNGYDNSIASLAGGGSLGGNVDLGSATLSIVGGDSTTYAGVISGSGGLNQAGAGTTILTGNNTYSGATSVNEGTLQIGDGTSGSIGNTSAVSVGANGTLVFNQADGSTFTAAIANDGSVVGNEDDGITNTLSGDINGAGSFVQNGAGTTILAGNNSYSGGTVINAGTVSISSDNNLGDDAGVVTLNGGTLQFTSGLTVTRNFELGTSGGTLSASNSAAVAINGTFTGDGGLTTTGNGLVVLGGDQTYTGETVIAGGNFRVDANGANTFVFDSSSVNIASGSIFFISDSTTYAGSIFGAGELMHIFYGTAILTGDATQTGGTAIGQNGGIQIGDGGTTGSLAGNVTNYGTLTFDRSDDITFSGNVTDDGGLSGPGSLVQLGTGMLTLSGSNSYTGGTTVANGVLDFAKASAMPSTGAITVDSGATLIVNAGGAGEFTGATSGAGSIGGVLAATTFNTGSSFAVDTTNAAATVTYAGNITNSGMGLIKLGVGTLALSGTNTYTGGTMINGGTLLISSDNNLGNAAGVVTLNGGTLQTSTNIVTSRNFVIGDGGGTFAIGSGFYTLSGTVSGTGTLTKTGGSFLTLDGASTYTGDTIVLGGKFKVTGSSFASSSVSISSGATFYLTNSQTYAGSISGAGLFDRDGAGTTILTGDASQTGGTTITAGTLQIGDGGTSGSLSGNVLDQGTLTFDRSDDVTFSGNITDNNGAGGQGSLIKAGSGVLTLTGTSDLTSQIDIQNGTLQVGDGASGSLGGSANLTIENGASLAIVAGGKVTDTSGFIGDGSTGDATVTGPGASWINASYLEVGEMGSGSLTISDGGSVSDGLLAVIGDRAEGTVLVTGAGSTWTSSGPIYIGNGSGGIGTLTISDGGLVTGSGPIYVGSGGVGILNIGAAAGDIAAAPGMLTGTSVVLGDSGGNGTIVFNHTDTGYVFGAAISGTGTVDVLSGTTILTGTNTYAGTTTVNGGALQIGNGTSGSLAGGTSITVGGSGTLSFDQVNGNSFSGDVTDNGIVVGAEGSGITNTLSGTLSGSGGFTQAGAGTTILSGDNSYTGLTVIDAGTLTVGSATALGNTSGVTFSNTSGATLDLNGHDTSLDSLSGGGALGGNVNLGSATLTITGSSTSTYGGAISGSGGFTQDGAGTTILSGANSYSGLTVVDSGILDLAQSQALSGSTSVVVADGATLAINVGGSGEFTNATSGAGSIGGILSSATFNDGSSFGIDTTNAGGSVTYAGNITNAGMGLAKLGTGSLILSGTNTYTGPTTIGGGTLVLDSSLSDQSAVSITASGAALDINGSQQTIGSLSGVAGSSVYLGGGTLTIGANNTDTTFSGNISDSGGVSSGTGGSLVKVGTRILTLDGNNTYSGATYVNEGTLIAGSSTALGSHPDIILANTAGANLVLGDYNISIDSISGGGADGGNLGLNNTILTITGTGVSTFGGSISGGGALIKAGAGTLIFSGASSLLGSTFVNAGTLQFAQRVSMSSFSVITVNNGGTLVINAGGTGEFDSTGIGDTLSQSIFKPGSFFAIDTSNATGSVGFGHNITNVGMGLEKLGTGTLFLLGASTYTGGTYVEGGTLQIGSGSTIGSISGDVVDNATLAFNRSDNITFAGNISGSGALNQIGAGTLNLTGNDTYTGGTTVSRGTIEVGVGGSVAGNVSVNSGGTIGGGGTVGGKITVAAGGKTYPGDPQILTAGSVEYKAGSTAEFAIDTNGNHAPVAGTDYDQIKLMSGVTPLTIESGATLTLDLGTLTLQTLQANVGTANDTYLLFDLQNGTSTAMFSSLTLQDGATTYTASIIHGNATFSDLDLEFAFSDSLTDPNSGETGFGFNVLSAAVPEPSDYAPLVVLLLGFAIWLRRRKMASTL